MDDFDRTEILYHYTSAVGLESILRQRCLRATDTAFLNDWQEVIFAAEPLIEQMEVLLGSVRQDDAINNPQQRTRSIIVDSALNAIRRFVRLDAQIPAANPGQYIDGATYVTCFCEDHDQLGQWRGYGQGGYSIGFRKDGLTKLHRQLRKVLYGKSGRDATCEEIIEHFRSRRLGGHPGTYGYFDALNLCMPRLAAVKHGAFEQEIEWRLIVSSYDMSHHPVQVRTSPRLTPYVELDFESSCIAEIVIGPGGDFHSERAVRAALRSHGHDPDMVRITQSKAPFRG